MVSKAIKKLVLLTPNMFLSCPTPNGEGRIRTSSISRPLSQPVFVAPRQLADRFVPGRQSDDAQERDDQGKGAGYAPAGEDDAEICRVPGEEHLVRIIWSGGTSRVGRGGRVRRTFMEHMGWS